MVWSDKSQQVADSINKSGGKATSVPGDILNDEYINSLVKKAAEFGNGKIHIIVNNAGFTWDGEKDISKSGLGETYADMLFQASFTKSRISNGTPSSLCMARLPSSSSELQRPTSVSRMASHAAL